jgi:hypothetical protein
LLAFLATSAPTHDHHGHHMPAAVPNPAAATPSDKPADKLVCRYEARSETRLGRSRTCQPAKPEKPGRQHAQ